LTGNPLELLSTQVLLGLQQTQTYFANIDQQIAELRKVYIFTERKVANITIVGEDHHLLVAPL